MILGLVIGSYDASTRAEGLTLGFHYGQLLAAGFCPVVLWWRVYRTMWLEGPRRHAQSSEIPVETNSSRSLERKRPAMARSKPQTKPEETKEETEKPRPNVSRRCAASLPYRQQSEAPGGGRFPQLT